jgi:hypothetical protein
MADPPSVLQTELETYDRRREELLGMALGKWVLIKGDELSGVFDTQDDAVSAGYRTFGNVPFLVKQVVPFDNPTFFLSSLIAP